MEHRRVDEAQGHTARPLGSGLASIIKSFFQHLPCKRADKADETVQVGGASPGDQRAKQDDSGSEDVLFPFDFGVVLAGSYKEAILPDSYSWEEL